MTEQDHIDELIANWREERPDYDLATVQIIGRLGRLYEYVDRALEAKFEEFDISRATFDVLTTLKRSGPPHRLAQRELMKNLLRTSGSISVRIDAMEGDGLVRREADAEDRRSTLVAITDKGIELLEKIIPDHLQNEERLLSGLTPGDRRELIRLLRKWCKAIEADSNDRYVYYGMVVLEPRIALQRRRAVGLPDVVGVLVHTVETGGIAEEAGIRKGDLITAIEDSVIDSQASLRRVLNKPIPKVKRFKILRGAQAVEIKLPKTS